MIIALLVLILLAILFPGALRAMVWLLLIVICVGMCHY